MTPTIRGLSNPTLNPLSSLLVRGPAGGNSEARAGASSQTIGPAATLNISPEGQLLSSQGRHHAHGLRPSGQPSLSGSTASGGSAANSTSGVSDLFGRSDSNAPASMTTRAS